MDKEIKLTEQDLLFLKDLLEIAIEDDVFDLPSYDSISRGDKISGAWKGLEVIERILK
jgi:hypothetical protein